MWSRGLHIPNTQPINGPYFLEVEISDNTVQFADILRAAAFAMAGPILRRHTGSGTRLYWHRRRLPGGIRRRMAAISQVLLQVQRAVSECDGRHQVQKGASMGEQAGTSSCCCARYVYAGAQPCGQKLAAPLYPLFKVEQVLVKR